jgi:hypothetical protein
MLFWGQIFEAKQGNWERSCWPFVASSIFNQAFFFYLLTLPHLCQWKSFGGCDESNSKSRIKFEVFKFWISVDH